MAWNPRALDSKARALTTRPNRLHKFTELERKNYAFTQLLALKPGQRKAVVLPKNITMLLARARTQTARSGGERN